MTLANDHGAAQALAMIEDAGATTISFDPNCRPNLVRDKACYVGQMDAFAAAADIVRMSDVDFEFLYGGGDYEERAKALMTAGTSLFVVTRGTKGAQAWHRAAGPVKVEAPTIDALTQMNAGELHRALSFAAACAAFTCSRAGADPPHYSDVGPAFVSSFCQIGTNQARVPRSSPQISGKGRSWRKAAVRFEQTDKIRLGAQPSLPFILHFQINRSKRTCWSPVPVANLLAGG